MRRTATGLRRAAHLPIQPGTAGFYADFAPDTEAIRRGLKALDAPVLILAGELDPAPTPQAARLLADLFPRAVVAVQDGAGHFPWLDDAAAFTRIVRDFL